MDDRKNEKARPSAADRGREGFGDDQGTRVGRPDAAKGASGHTGPSTQPVDQGLEGAILDDSGRGGTGAGAEAAEGTEGAQQHRSASDRSSVDASSSSTRGGADRRGSEPLADRDEEHVSGYGGAAGQPKRSSDQREGRK